MTHPEKQLTNVLENLEKKFGFPLKIELRVNDELLTSLQWTPKLKSDDLIDTHDLKTNHLM
jgi:hypothetical protein